MTFFNRQSSIVNRKSVRIRPLHGVVMIEFTLAAVGLVAMAYMTVRVGQWLNDAMVERNASYQASRPLAGRGPGVTPFSGPATPLRLIGPRASRTPGQGTPGGGQSATRPTCGDDLLGQANAKRRQVISLLMSGQNFTLPEQSQITYLNAINWNMLVEANYLAWHAIRVDTIRADLLNRIYPRLRQIQNMDIVQGNGSHDICAFSNSNPVAGHDLCPLQVPQGIHQIDERLAGILHELDPTAAGTVGFERAAWYARLQEIADALNPFIEGSLGQQVAVTYAALIQAQAACADAGGGVVSGGPWDITSCFGPATHPPGGIDIGAPCGSATVQAFRGGTVIIAVSDQPDRCDSCGYGNYVMIDHGNGFTTLYAHLQDVDLAITPGSHVDPGQLLGTVGNSGHTEGITGCHLHYEHRSQTTSGTRQVDPLGGQTCVVNVTTSEALGAAPVGTCDQALVDALNAALTDPGGLLDQVEALRLERDDINNNKLPPLNTLYNYLVGEMYGLWALDTEVNGGWGLQVQTYYALDEVDGIVSSWRRLWQQLHPGTELWPEDLSTLFQTTIQAWDAANANSPDTVVLEQIPDDLDQIIPRLLEMMLERLDRVDWSELPSGVDYRGQIPQGLLDRFDRFHLLPPVSPDTINPGGQREANARIRPLAGHPLIAHFLVEYTEDIGELILEAEELERQARRDCTSSSE